MTKEDVIDVLKNYGYNFKKNCQILINSGIDPKVIPDTDPHIEYMNKFYKKKKEIL